MICEQKASLNESRTKYPNQNIQRQNIQRSKYLRTKYPNLSYFNLEILQDAMSIGNTYKIAKNISSFSAICLECKKRNIKQRRSDQQCIEGWNNRFSNLMRHENAADETKVAQRQLGTIGPPLKNKRKDIILKYLCEEYNDGSRDISNFLNAIANFIRN
ncbi:hypothetical protein QTP88_005706 [Uroleucon formosanum]